MKLVTVHLPPAYIEGLRELVKRGRYPNQSEAIRAAVRDLLREELWRREKVEPIFLEA
ncbi:MAG: CopG family transcriptional regulator [Archaeoglobales archaeon]|nr:MAG: CopG family transcriptional regulator [Archaeoglobales archaeon]